jgi:magnesium chelatase family protein
MKTNANVQKRELITYLDLESPARSTLGKAIDTYFLSGRGMTRVLRVARTIADIEGSGPVRERHIERALQLRLCAAEEGEDR